MKGAPMSGLRFLEFGQIAAGPFVGMLLADLGAEVVKVERPDGDDGIRDWPPLVGHHGDSDRFSGNFASFHRNKRSFTVDLKDQAAVRRLRDLCGVTTRTVGFPVRMSGYQFEVERQPPVLGEHTDEVFQQGLKKGKV
jgi:crotonobetainyl-CoA:carnitine CoA-transferase CaiB-like acyl-CoA transferase